MQAGAGLDSPAAGRRSPAERPHRGKCGDRRGDAVARLDAAREGMRVELALQPFAKHRAVDIDRMETTQAPAAAT